MDPNEFDEVREQLFEAAADQLCRMMPEADREYILRQLREQAVQLDAVRERTSRTPMNDEQAQEYVNSILPVLYSHPRALLQ